jgi:hypothetical protein
MKTTHDSYAALVNGCGYTQTEIETALRRLPEHQQRERLEDARSFASQALGNSRAFWGRLAACLIRRGVLREKLAFEAV